MTADSPEMTRVLYQALCACLGLSPDTAAAAALVQAAYAGGEAAPQPPPGRNVIYFSLLREAEPPGSAWPQTRTGRDGAETVRSLLAYRLLAVCLGPDAERHAHRIRSLLFQDGAGQPRALLRQAGIFPVPRPPQPLLVTEIENGLPRRRADAEISLRVRDEISVRASGIRSAPDIIIHR